MDWVRLCYRFDWNSWFGFRWSRLCRWNKLSEKLSVTLGDGPGTINTDLVAVMWTNLNDHTCLGPLLRIVAMLVLNEDLVPFLEWRKLLGASGQLLLCCEPGLGMRLLSCLGC